MEQSIRWSLVLSIVVCLFITHTTAPAGIVGTGNFSPTLPWSSSTTGYVGKTADGTLAVDDEDILYSRYAYLGYDKSKTGTVTVTGENSKWNNSSTIYVGRSGNGLLNVENGGSLATGTAYIGLNTTSAGTVTVTGEGSKWTGSAYVYIGRAGNGQLNITDGGQVSNTNAYIGDLADSSGTVTADGADSKWTCSGNLYVGNSGSGVLNIYNQSTVTATGTAYLGYNTGAAGAIDFGANGGTLTAKSLCAGTSQLTGTGTLNLRGLVSDIDLIFDEDHELEQSLSINDSPARNIAVNLDMSNAGNVGDLGAGWTGSGSLSISDEVQVRSTAGYLGYHAGSNGSATVTGENSKWTVNEALYVGRSGTGTIEVSNGAEMLLNSAYTGSGSGFNSYIGYSSGSTGTMTIDAASVSGKVGMIVGNNGSGTLNIINGGVFDNSATGTYSGRLNAVGYGADSVGNVTVAGAGSTWSMHPAFYVGYYGTGALEILNGGEVNSLVDAYVGYNAGASGIVTVDGLSSVWNVGASLDVGEYGIGHLYVLNGAAVDVYHTVGIGGPDESGSSITIDGSGSSITCQYIGVNQYGKLNIKNGAILTASEACNIYGEISVDGIGSSLTCESLNMTGVLDISNGAIVSNSGKTLFEFGSEARINLDNGTFITKDLVCPPENLQGTGVIHTNGLTGDYDLVFDSTHGLIQTIHLNDQPGQDVSIVLDLSDPSTVGSLSVGYYNKGSLLIKDGIELTSGSCSIGYDPGATGTVTVDGEGTVWSSSIRVGFFGQGSLNVMGGAVVHGSLHIGCSAGPGGTATVDGVGSAMEYGSVLSIRNGSLYVTNGGRVATTGNGYIGQYENAMGIVCVDGTGSTLDCGDSLNVGHDGEGTLAVTNGGTVTGGYRANAQSRIAYFGKSAETDALVIIDGAGSSFANNGPLYVGYLGKADLNISNGGAVTIEDTTYVGYAAEAEGSIHFDNGTLATRTLAASGSQLHGIGEINARGMICDFDLRFDQTHGLSQSFAINGLPGQNISVNLDMSDPDNIGDLGAGWRDSGSVMIRDGINIASTNGYLGFQAGSTGVITVTDDNTCWTAYNIYVGKSGSGTLNISNGGTVSIVRSTAGFNGYSCIGQDAGSEGHVTVSGESSCFNNSTLTVGYNGHGTIEISDRGTVICDALTIGNVSGSVGVITVSGTGSALQNGGYSSSILYQASIGHYGSGTLAISEGATVISSSFHTYIGYYSGSYGCATVTGDGSVLDFGANGLTLGSSGHAALNILDGGEVNCSSTTIGYYSTSDNIATVSGNGSAWHNQAELYLGYKGNGTLAISQGGTVENTYCVLGRSSGATGKAFVDGIGSAWTNSSYVYVGDDGNGTVSVTAGGTVSSVSAYLGYDSGSNGNVTVSGDGSAWNVTGELYVGRYGNASFRILDGGNVGSGSGKIGYGSSSVSSLVLDGSGSEYSTTGDLEVGHYGAAMLSIFGGAAATAANASISSKSVLAIDVCRNSMLALNGTNSTLTNDGTVRVIAGADAAAGSVYSPISATTWKGGGSFQAVGGVWDDENHQFKVSNVESGNAGTQLSLDLSATQRAVIGDGGEGHTGWSLGMSFLHKTGDDIELLVTATACEGDTLADLESLVEPETVMGAWEVVLDGDGYTDADSIYLSFAVDEGTARGDFLVWHFDGSSWSAFDAMDLTVNDGWASFTATEFSGYALSALPSSTAMNVPEPGMLALLAAAALGLFVRFRGHIKYPWLRVLSILVLLFTLLPAWSASAGLYLTGDTDPTAAADWVNNIKGYVGNNADGTLTFDGGSKLYLATVDVGFSSGVTGIVNINDAETFWSAGTILCVGTSGNGILNVSGGATAAYTTGYVGHLAGSIGEVNVDGINSSWCNGSLLHVGSSGNGTLNVTNGAMASNQDCYVGYSSDSIGEVNVTGTGSTWSLWGNLHVGNYGSGTLNLSGGALITCVTGDDAYIGYESNSTGTVTITDANSAWTGARDVFVGYYGEGTLKIANGATVNNTQYTTTHQLYVGYESGSTGEVTVSGIGSSLISGDLYVGNNGHGTLSISDGAQASTSRGYIGYYSESNSAEVTGEGSSWNVTYGLYIGKNGSGSLRIADGADVVSSVVYEGHDSFCYIGYEAEARGSIVVDGEGSTWTNSSDLYVGYYGTGTLEISNGACVENKTAYIGNNNSECRVSVSGSESLWTNNGSINVGCYYSTPGYGSRGLSTLEIVGGGEVRSAGGMIGSAYNSSGEVLVDGNGSKWIDDGCLIVGGCSNASLTISNGAYLSSRDSCSIGNESLMILSGVVTVKDAGSAWEHNGELTIGCYGNGTLNIEGGGSVSVLDTAYVAYYSTALGTIAFDGGTLNTGSLAASPQQLTGTGTINARGIVSDIDLVFDSAESLEQSVEFEYHASQSIVLNLDLSTNPDGNGAIGAGWMGEGTMVIKNGITVNSNRGIIGHHLNAVGLVSIDGDSTKWSNAGELHVGYYGNGTLKITNAAEVSNGSSSIGYYDDALGAIVVHGANSKWMQSGSLRLGVHGEGSLMISNGAAVVGDICDIGVYQNSKGTAVVAGEYTSWELNSITIGRSGNGVLNISDGATINISGNAGIGYYSQATGAVSVEGGGTAWDINGSLHVAYAGNGSLSIRKGGSVCNSDGVIGYFSEQIGSVEIAGVGSTWANSGTLRIGYIGIGLLDISEGATVSNTTGCIADLYGSNGIANVDGHGSSWGNDGHLYIGKSGKGILAITGNGYVSAHNASVNSKSLLAIDVANGSSLALDDSTGEFTNEGTVRIIAGANAAVGNYYAPIHATTWEGNGVYQAVGGTWDNENHRFIASDIASGNSGAQLSLDLSATQRAAIVDSAEGHAGWSVGISFLHKSGEDTNLLLTATAYEEDTLAGLELLLEPYQTIEGAWEIALDGDGWVEDDPVYLSFHIGEGNARSDLLVWHFDGASWALYDAMDLTYNDGWASFTATEFSGYAVTAAVPEPGTIVLLLLAALGLAAIARRKRR